MIIYVVTMQRNGDSESHNYVIGAWSDLAIAAIEGLSHKLYRANKYEPKIEILTVDNDKKIEEVPYTVFVQYAKMRYPDKFDSHSNIIDT